MTSAANQKSWLIRLRRPLIRPTATETAAPPGESAAPPGGPAARLAEIGRTTHPHGSRSTSRGC